MTAADLLSLADAHEEGDCPEAVLLDAAEDAGHGRWEWRKCLKVTGYLDLVPADCPHDNSELQHHAAMASCNGDYGNDYWGIGPKVASYYWGIGPQDAVRAPAGSARRAATAAFVRKLAGV